jgi:hypothetical protein
VRLSEYALKVTNTETPAQTSRRSQPLLGLAVPLFRLSFTSERQARFTSRADSGSVFHVRNESPMRFFRHIIAEHPCSKQCGYCRSDIEPNMSPFHLIAAAIATVPLWLFSIHENYPWYYLVCILGGELLLVFVSGILSSIFMLPFTIPNQAKSCPKCGAPLFFAGRHYDPLGSERPHLSDIVIFVVFVALNIAVWIFHVRGDL